MKNDGLVETKQKGMMLAAAIGYYLEGNKAEPREMGAGEGIRMEYFQKVRDDGFVDALAVTAKGSLQLLEGARAEERIEIFERYAQVGLLELQRVCYSGQRKPLDGLLDLIDRAIAGGANELPDPRESWHAYRAHLVRTLG